MVFESILAAVLIAAISLIGVLFFGNNERLIGAQKYAIPMAVGVFLSLILFTLIPETLEQAPVGGGLMIGLGFISFYVLSHLLHKKFHHLETEECDHKKAATLLLIGDSIHNAGDGIVLVGAFLIDPAIGVAVAISLGLHEIPQEIIEFGILIRAGYTRKKAMLLNLLSASSIILGVLLMLLVAEYAAAYAWILSGIAAGNLLFLAASDLLPRIHGNLKNYGSIWHSTASITVGFVLMTGVIVGVPEQAEGNLENNEQLGELEGYVDEV